VGVFGVLCFLVIWIGFARWARASSFLLREKKGTKENTP
jgi:hypothetical protein